MPMNRQIESDDSSSSGSVPSKSSPSPYSSPSQEVPQLSNSLKELSWAGHNNGCFIIVEPKPSLQIIEQPQSHFRFRYGSEMTGTHGCLLGKTSNPKTKKTHPTVELVNYQGQAYIKCNLVQHDKPEEHPHKLVDDDQDVDASKKVPENGSYIVGFRGISIIHTAKKDVITHFRKKLKEKNGRHNGESKDLHKQCENMAKAINYNIVRLKFSAHDIHTGEEICEPVYSEPIYNLKSSATNDLKICRMSRSSGSASGGEDVFIFVEKVNKKNTMIRFFELDDKGERIWTGIGHFNHTDVHHQYAIVFRTPPYKDRETPVDVPVYIELVRTSDGRTSEPKEFKYKAEQVYKHLKRRKMQTPRDTTNGPCMANQEMQSVIVNQFVETLPSDTRSNPATPYVYPGETVEAPLSNLTPPVEYESVDSTPCDLDLLSDPMWGPTYPMPIAQQSVTPQPLNTTDEPMTSAEFETLNIPSDTTFRSYFKEYLDQYNLLSTNITHDSARFERPNTVDGQMQTDPSGSIQSHYGAFYTAAAGAEVKKLVTDVCEMIQKNKYFKKQEIRSRLEKVFEKRLSNGDTFLHMTMCASPPTLECIVKVIHNVKATHLLDCANDRLQTTLHLAVLNDMPNIVSLLVANGANPMLKDVEDLNAVHYAVKYKSCLEPLLDAIKKNEVACDLNEFNGEKQSALHMSVVRGSERSARLLLQHGASHRVRDDQGRTPLHLAAYDDRLAVTNTLLEFIPLGEIDITDNLGNTALQIVCGGQIRDNTIAIARLLLEKKANPLKKEDRTESAWRLVRNKPELKTLLSQYLVAENDEDGDNSSTEDDFESADEGDSGDDITLRSLAVALDDIAQTADAAGI